MDKLTILKVGGNVLDNPDILTNLLDYFASLTEKRILVHGGGKIANVLMEKMGIQPKW